MSNRFKKIDDDKLLNPKTYEKPDDFSGFVFINAQAQEDWENAPEGVRKMVLKRLKENANEVQSKISIERICDYLFFVEKQMKEMKERLGALEAKERGE